MKEEASKKEERLGDRMRPLDHSLLALAINKSCFLLE